MPNKLPEGDPSEFALPVFLEEPKKTYATKERSGSLTCRVAHAKTVHFTCDGEEMKSSTEQDGVATIGSTKSKYKEITIDVRRSQVLDTLEKCLSLQAAQLRSQAAAAGMDTNALPKVLSLDN